jgi:hypothetical protein
LDTLLTLPIEPPAAGPDRALDPPLDPGAVLCAAVVEEVVAAAELDVPPQAESPSAGTSSAAAAAMDVVRLCRRIRFRRVMVALPLVLSVRGLIALTVVLRSDQANAHSGSRSRTCGRARCRAS